MNDPDHNIKLRFLVIFCRESSDIQSASGQWRGWMQMVSAEPEGMTDTKRHHFRELDELPALIRNVAAPVFQKGASDV